jgi:hypothetical protein
MGFNENDPGGEASLLCVRWIDARKGTLLLLSTFAALLATTGSAGAQRNSVFNEHFCSMPGADSSTGLPDCSFRTWD